MKNSDLILKAKKDGLNSLSIYELRRLANLAWKEDCFGLNGLVKYVQFTEDPYLATMLTKTGLKKDVITVKWLLSNCDPNQLKKQTKNPDTGKLEPTNEKRTMFGLWFVSGTIQRFHAAIQAKAQSSAPQTVKKVETVNIVEETAKEEQKTAAKVEANKRRNNSRKNAIKKAA